MKKSPTPQPKTRSPKPPRATKPPKTYHLHRERQRRRILDAARDLFDARGIDRTPMAEIVTASGLQPSTLYEYFAKKDEIVWAILSEIIAADARNLQARLDTATTGLARITALLHYMADQLAHHPSTIRFLAQFDAMYARDWPVERLLTLEGQLPKQGFQDRGFQIFTTLIRQGIADGSLRADLIPDLTLHAVINGLLGAQRRLASLGSKVEIEYGQPIHLLFHEMVRITLLGLSAPAPRKITSTKKRIK